MTDLTDAEIDNICDGYVQSAAKIRYLRSLGLTVQKKPNGRPLVNRAHYEAVVHPNEPEPDVSAYISTRRKGLNQGLKKWQAGRRIAAEAFKEMDAAWKRSKEYERIRIANSIRALEIHKALVRHHAAKRRASKQRQSPVWADQSKIKLIYQHAKDLTKSTGIEHHVDHIIPLSGRLVSGLHVHDNLQVITAAENIRKNNKYEVDDERRA